MKTWLMVVAIFVPSVFGQTDLPITGTVVTKDGQPIKGVQVYGGLGKCCPFKREQTVTDKKGEFRLKHPGIVVHFFKESLQPQSLVVRTGSSALHITMKPSTNGLPLPVCGSLKPDHRRIGWGRYDLQFDVPEQSVDVQGGKPDADFVRYVIKPKNGEAVMEFWFGPYAIPIDPEDDQLGKSSNFEQRFLLLSGRVAGLDSWGHLRSGESWRHMAMVGSGGAIYQKASSKDAAFFDQIINSMCFIPYPSR